jgi:hypothetical protein
MYRMNPERRTMKRYININTKFRPFVKGIQPKNTDFTISLPDSINNVTSMKLKMFSAPDVEYTFPVSEDNNSFEVMSNDGKTTTITVIPGKYSTQLNGDGVVSSTFLLEQINSQLVPLGIEMVYINEIQRFAFTGNNITNIELNFDVHNNYIYNTFGWIMGFHHSYYSKLPKYSSTYPTNQCKKETGLVGGLINIGNKTYYMGDTPVILPNTSLYYMLYVDDFLNNVDTTFYEGCFPANNNSKNILAQIATRYAKHHNTFYLTDTADSYQRVYSGPVTLSKLHIRLFDDNNNIVEFNNSDYTFLLELVTTV